MMVNDTFYTVENSSCKIIIEMYNAEFFPTYTARTR